MERLPVIFIAVTSLGLSPAGQAQDASQSISEAIDPQAIELVEAAAEFLTSQNAFSFDWFVSYDEIVDGREKLTYTRNGTNVMARDQGFYSFAQTGAETREYFFDGSTAVIVDVEENAYVMAPFDGSFDALVDRIALEYDLHLPIWDATMSADPASNLLEDATAAAYLGTTTIAGMPAHHLAFASYESDWQIWISSDEDNPVLLMMVGTDPYVQGWPQFRAYFSGWNFSPELTPETFKYSPDDDAERMVWPKVSAPLLGEAHEPPAANDETEGD